MKDKGEEIIIYALIVLEGDEEEKGQQLEKDTEGKVQRMWTKFLAYDMRGKKERGKCSSNFS